VIRCDDAGRRASVGQVEAPDGRDTEQDRTRSRGAALVVALVLALAAVVSALALGGSAPSADDEAPITGQARTCLPEPEPPRQPAIEVTARENTDMRLRDRLRLGARADAYLRRHRDLSGGISIEGRPAPGPVHPRPAHAQPRAPHGRAAPACALPGQPTDDDGRAQLRQLRLLQERISFEAHTADGFHVMGTGPDIDRSEVQIELIIKRTDHRAYFAERCGPHARTEAIA
jgi:hypothetical protein